MEINLLNTIEVPAQWSLQPATHEGSRVILIQFEYSTDLNRRVHTVPGARWSRTLKSWYVSDTPANRRLLGLGLDPIGKEVLSHIHPVNQGALHRLIETLQLKAYSESTIRTYRNEFAQLLYVLKATVVDTLDAERLRSYFVYCITTFTTVSSFRFIYAALRRQNWHCKLSN
jgi:hypothetical protein